MRKTINAANVHLIFRIAANAKNKDSLVPARKGNANKINRFNGRTKKIIPSKIDI